MKSSKFNTIKIMYRAFAFIGKERRKYIIGWLLSCIEIILTFITPFFYRQLIEMVSSNSPNDKIFNLLLIIGIFFLLTPAVCLGSYLRRTSTYYGISEMKKQLFNHIQNIPSPEFSENTLSDYISRISTDASRAVGMFSAYSITGLVKFILYFSIGTYLLSRIKIELAILSSLLCFISINLTVIFNPKVRNLENEARKSVTSSLTYLSETFTAIFVVRVFLLQKILSKNFYKNCKEIYINRLMYSAWSGVVYAIINFFGYITQPLCFGATMYFAMNNKINFSQIIFAASLSDIIAKSAIQANTFIQFIQPSIVSAQRVFEVLDMPIEEKTSDKDLSINSDSINILEFKNVSFSYPNGNAVLRNINFTIKKGETVAILGESGSGKSTLCKLILGMYRPTDGEIFFMGKSIDKLNMTDIRNEISYVSQNCILFDCSIYENISFGKENATKKDIMRAAEKADIHDFILSCENKYDTLVGENGNLLSGGQKQRISLARGILKNGSILLLDEPTSALDPKTELQIKGNIDSISKEKTTIIITHRLNMVQNIDKLIVIKDGQIIKKDDDV